MTTVFKWEVIFLTDLLADVIKWLTAVAVLATAILNFLTTQENRKFRKQKSDSK